MPRESFSRTREKVPRGSGADEGSRNPPYIIMRGRRRRPRRQRLTLSLLRLLRRGRLVEKGDPLLLVAVEGVAIHLAVGR